MPTAEERLHELGLTLPQAAAPVANYVPWVQLGNQLFLAGLISQTPESQVLQGKLGATMTVDEGYQAARSCALRAIASAKAALGDLERLRRVVRMLGMVNSAPDFTGQPQVMNGASDLLVEVFGDRGRHARTAVGMASLPLGAAVEIEVLLEIDV